MFRLVRCIRRLEGSSPADFRRAWEDARYDPLLQRVADVVHADHWTKTITLRLEITARLMETLNSQNPFDGVIEVFWREPRDFNALTDSPGWVEADEVLREYESTFANLPGSMFFFTET